MRLSQENTILTLTRDYPFLIDDLAGRNKAFDKLKNPLLRNTMGRIATIGKAASMGQENVLDLLLFIAGRIMAVTGEPVEIVPPAAGQGTAVQKASLSDEERLAALKEMIRELHDGADIAQLQERFARTVGDITPGEIAGLEQTLVREGLPESEIKRLCHLHVELFKGSLDEQERPAMPPGHPVHTYMEENVRAAELADTVLRELDRLGEAPSDNIWGFTVNHLRALLAELADIRTHYVRKENQLFPLLERHGIEAPPKVMWEVHDDIRGKMRTAEELLKAEDRTGVMGALREAAEAIKDMIYKEEHILFPMALQTLDDHDWARARHGDDEIGYAFGVEPGTGWHPAVQMARQEAGDGLVPLDTGSLPVEIVNEMLRSLPVDMSFVDADDNVAYYSDTPHRIFPRSPAVIGRNVRNCHPQKSVHMVAEILEKFKSGERDTAEFWLELGGKFLHIQYAALRSRDGGRYLGCLEVAQDATHLRSLTGQRRLLEWD